MKKFHITITDNETGDVLIDADVCGLAGCFDRGGDTVESFCAAHADSLSVVSLAIGTRDAADELVAQSDLPEALKAMYHDKTRG